MLKSASEAKMQENPFPLHKLILLHIAGQTPGIRRSGLCDAALSTLSMDYFDVARALDELAEAKLIQVAARKGEAVLDAHDRAVERCDLTAKGQEVLSTLESQIPVTIRRYLSEYLDKTALDRRILDTVTATVEPTATGQYRVLLKQHNEQDEGFSLSCTFPTEKMAKKAAATWRESSAKVLQAIVKTLLESED
jgi:hypothetical protein